MRPIWAAILCLALAGCTVKKPGSVRIDPALETLIPAATVFIVGGNIDAVRQTVCAVPPPATRIARSR